MLFWATHLGRLMLSQASPHGSEAGTAMLMHFCEI